MTTPTEVRIAGVPWPLYKLIALAVGVLVLAVVGIAAGTGPAVVAAFAAGTVVWLALSIFSSSLR
jgi:Flp pilus assembly protein TadB